MERPTGYLRSFIAVMTIFVMVSSSMTMAIGPQSGPKDMGRTSTMEEKMYQRGLYTKLVPENGPGEMNSRTGGSRQTIEDDFEVVSPYPTSEDIYDVAFKPGSNDGLLVGRNGLVMDYDGVYFSVMDTDFNDALYGVDWSPSASFALLVGSSGTMYKYQSGKLTQVMTGTSGSIIGIDFAPDSDTALMVTNMGKLLQFKDDIVTRIADFNGVALTDVAWHPSDDTALIVGFEWVQDGNNWILQGRVFEYDAPTGKITNLRPPLANDVDTDLYSVDWSPFGDVALIGGWNGLILNYDGNVFGTESSGSMRSAFNAIEFASNGDALLVGGSGRVVRYSNGNLEDISTQGGSFINLNGVDFSPSGDVAVIVGDEGMVLTYDPSDKSLTQVSSGTSVTFFDVAWKPDWSYALLVGTQGSIFKYDGKALTAISSPTVSTLLGVAWSPDGNTAMIVGQDGTLLQYNDGGFGKPSIFGRLSGTTQTIWDIDFNSVGQALFVGDNGEVREWNGNFATKVVSRTNRNLMSVDWKDSTTAYIGGDNGEILRYRRGPGPTSFIDIASPSNIQVQETIWSVLWEDTKQSGLMSGSFGGLFEHFENLDATTLDDSYDRIETNTFYDLFDLDYDYDKSDVLVVGDFGTVFDLRDSTNAIRELTSPSNERLNGVDWKSNQYALIVGGGGVVLKYWPNLEPTAVVLSSPTDITDNSMKVSWTRSNIHDFHHYELHMSQSEDFTMTPYTRIKTFTDADTTHFDVKDLTRDTTYYFKVRVVDDGGLSADSNEVYGHTQIGQIPPKAVVLYNPTDITSSAMILDWSRNRDTDFDHYELHMAMTEGFNTSGATVIATIDDQFETTYSAQDLSANTTYYFKLKVVDEDGLFNDSNEVNGTTEDLNYPPTAVTLNDPFNITDDTLELNWSENEDADFARYELHISTEMDFNLTSNTKEASMYVRNETSYAFTGLNPDTSYYFRVRVFDSGGLSSDSEQVNATTLKYNPPPEPVELYEPANITETTVNLTWSMNNDTDFERYEVHVAKEAGFIPNASTLEDSISTKNLTRYEVTGLIPGITYSFRIRVVDGIGQTADSNDVIAKTSGNAPPEAVHLSVSDVGETDVTLRWTKNNDSDFARYEVHYSTDPNFTIDPSTLWDDITGQGARTSVITGLESNSSYYFLVRVVDQFNLYNDSNKVNATTKGPNLPPRAVIVGEPQNITRTSMEIYWSESLDPDFKSYELHRSTTMGFEPDSKTLVLKFTGVDQTFYNVSGLKMDTKYHFKVRIYDDKGLFNDSNEVMGKTLPPNQRPIADAGSDMDVFTTDKVQFNGVGVDPDGKIVKYEWDFETDGIWDFESEVSGVSENLYTTAGLYIASFRVTDNDLETATDTINISVEEPPLPNQAPRAMAGPDQTVTEGDVVLFDGSGEDTDGTIVLYEWDFDGNGDYDAFSYDDGYAEYKYDDEGVYKARLRVKDNENLTGTDIAIIRVEPKNRAPVAKIVKPLDGRKYKSDVYIAFDGTKSYDDDGDSLTYEWTDSMTSGILSTKKKFSKLMKQGHHTITLKVSDGKDSKEDEITIIVEEPVNIEPTIKINEPTRNSRVKGIVTISGKASDEDGSIVSVCIKIDTGNCQKAKGTKNWIYEWNSAKVTKGTHTIKVIGKDDRDGETEESVVVTVLKDKKTEPGFLESIPGFDAPLLLAAGALVGIALAYRRRRY